MTIATVGVVGGGVIGVGVAEDLFQAGYRVLLIDVSDHVLDQAKQRLKNNMRLHRLLQKGGERSSAHLLDEVVFSTDYQRLCGADFVIENVTENWSIKRRVYEMLEASCPDHTVFAANTSAVPITKIASVTRRPARVIGMHFMNPVPMQRTVEVIRGYHTSEATLAKAEEILRRMGKEFVTVNDSPGFVSNRVLMLTVNEAIQLVQEQVASADAVDRIFRECFGHKMGPLETADLIGLDTVLYSIEMLYESFNDSKYRPSPLLRKMVAAGLYGRKNGAGFYKYADEMSPASASETKLHSSIA